MTSQVSLTANSRVRRYRPWAHSFWQAIGESMLLTILCTILFLAVIVLPTIVILTSRNGLGEATYSSIKYFLFDGSTLSLLFPALALLSALLQGVMAFRFLFNRSAANVWFGMGLSRHELFCSRYAAGAAGALLPLVVTMLATLAVNLALFADTGLALARIAFFTLGMGLQILALYSVVVLVCCACKTLAEGIAYSVILMALPTLLGMSLNGLLLHLLPGNGFGLSDTLYYSWNTALIRELSDWNPLIFMSQYISRFGSESKLASTGYQEYLASLPPLPIRWALIPGWLAATGALLWFAHRVFLKTRVEHTGVLGAGKATAYTSVLTVGFFAFGLVYMLPLYTTMKLSTGAMLAIAVASASLVMLAAALPLRLLRRRVWMGLLPLVTGLAAMLALVGVLVSGGLGYSGFVPKAEEVKSIEMSYNGLDFYMPMGNGGSSGGGLVPDMSYENYITLEDNADIAAAIEVHRALTQAGLLSRNMKVDGGRAYGAVTQITYTMANGDTVTRAYQALTPDLIRTMMALDNTAAVKKAYRDHLLSNEDEQPSWEVAPYRSGNVYLCAPFFGSTQLLGLDEAQHEKLLKCIADDLAAQTPEDRYLPAKPETCILTFTAQGGTTEDAGYEGRFVSITEQFTETLAYLRENGWMNAIQNTAEIEYLGLLDYDKISHSYDYNAMHSFPIFYSGFGAQQDIERYKQSDELKFFLSDKVQQQEVLSRSRSLYLASEGGYVVFIKYKGEDRVVSAFLPAKDAPDYVVEGTK